MHLELPKIASARGSDRKTATFEKRTKRYLSLQDIYIYIYMSKDLLSALSLSLNLLLP